MEQSGVHTVSGRSRCHRTGDDGECCFVVCPELVGSLGDSSYWGGECLHQSVKRESDHHENLARMQSMSRIVSFSDILD